MSDVANQPLSDYRVSRSEAAFAVLVRQHIDLVYSAARRIVAGDTHLAEDVTQTVFADLARKAARLPADVILSAWLHRHTFFVASSMIRTEQRRRRREQEALIMNTASEANDADWSALADHLDDAMNQLPEADRQALILRFFDRLELSVVGTRIGVGEDAAQKRVSRAVDKLRRLFTRRGITISSTSLGGLLLANAVSAAPVALASQTVSVVIAGGAAGTGLFFTLQQLLSMNAIKPIIGAALLAGLSVPLFLQHQSLAALREQNTALAGQVTEVASLRTENERLARLASGAGELESLRKDQLELARLRNEHTQLNRLLDELRREVERQRELLAAHAAAAEEGLTDEERQARRQIMIESKFVEMPVDSPVWREFGLQPPTATLTNGISYLISNDTAQLLTKRLEETEGVDVVFAPRVLTTNGRQTQVKTVDVQTIVTGKNAEGFTVEPMEFGPVIDFVPTLAPDSGDLQMTTIATFNQFLGYDDPSQAVFVDDQGKVTGVPDTDAPLPRFQFRQVQANVTVPPGHTLVLAGGYAESREKTTGSEHGDVRATRKGLIVMISPNEVSPAGEFIGQNASIHPVPNPAAVESAADSR